MPSRPHRTRTGDDHDFQDHRLRDAAGLRLRRHVRAADHGIQALAQFRRRLPLRLTAEILTFGSRRLQAQAEHVAALGRCGSPAETIKLQTDFLLKTFTDYQREADTLSGDVVDVAVPGNGKSSRSASA